MLRYPCPQCSHLLQTHELRAGKKSVCISCLSPHVIPTDRSAWLGADGEPLFPRQATPVESAIQTSHEAVTNTAATTFNSIDTASVAESTESPGALLADAPDSDRDESLNALSHEIPETVEKPLNDHLLAVQVNANHDASIEGIDRAFGEPIHVQTQAEIAAALTEVLTHRMKPPRHPRRDLRLSTAAWLVLTGFGIAFLLLNLFTSANHTFSIIALGMLEILGGYGWIIWLTSHRNPQRGLACALPPITFYYLGQWKYAKYRPLRFVLSGIVLVGLGLLASKISPTTRGWAKGDSHNHSTPAPDPEKMSKLEKVREYKKQRAYDKLIDLLQDLTKTDPQKSVDAQDGAELAEELKALCNHQDTGVKVAAIAAYARWGGDKGLDICLNAIQSSSQEERMAAIQLLPQWKNTEAAPEVARAIASLVGRPGIESSKAEAALVEVGGVAAERAALGLLLRSEDQTTRLLVLTILDKVGGSDAIDALQSYADTSLDEAIRSKSKETIEAIRRRMPKKDK